MLKFLIDEDIPNEISTSELNNQIIKAFDTLTEKDFDRNLIILEPARLELEENKLPAMDGKHGTKDFCPNLLGFVCAKKVNQNAHKGHKNA